MREDGFITIISKYIYSIRNNNKYFKLDDLKIIRKSDWDSQSVREDEIITKIKGLSKKKYLPFPKIHHNYNKNIYLFK